ncbi:MAG: RnfABCDGE type electron transport complex subunit B [Gammaproteobacteria bacterium]
MNRELAKTIEGLLPQYQCGRCDTPGCRDYAIEIAEGKPYNRCVPGGNDTLLNIIDLLKPPEIMALDLSYGPKIPDQIANIIEEECIGCKKCIDACPVNAIHGAPNLMHSVIADICTGCELCIPPCPVDCIELISSNNNELMNAKSRSAELYEIKERINQKSRIKITHSKKENIDLANEINKKLDNRNIDKEENLKILQAKLLNKKI